MSVFFTSDLHLGHKLATEKRGFKSVEEHDEEILGCLSSLTKRDKLFILGDVAFSLDSLPLLDRLSCTKDLVLGNHDQFQSQVYLKYFNRLWGFVGYKNFWLSHAPMHPQEIMYRKRGNIHGHIHNNATTTNIGYPYFNAQIDFHYRPIPFEEIEDIFTKGEGDE